MNLNESNECTNKSTNDNDVDHNFSHHTKPSHTTNDLHVSIPLSWCIFNQLFSFLCVHFIILSVFYLFYAPFTLSFISLMNLIKILVMKQERKNSN